MRSGPENYFFEHLARARACTCLKCGVAIVAILISSYYLSISISLLSGGRLELGAWGLCLVLAVFGFQKSLKNESVLVLLLLLLLLAVSTTFSIFKKQFLKKSSDSNLVLAVI